MKQLLLMFALFCALPAQGWQQPLPLDQVLQRLQENVAQFESALPDFICDERITSMKLSNGKPDDPTVNDSTFVSRQTRGKNGHMNYFETREMIAINGRKVPKGQKLKGPFLMTGGFSGTLTSIFDQQIAQYRDYRLMPPESRDGKTMLVVAFSTKDGQKELSSTSNGKLFIQKDSGKAWVDPDSMQIIRLENGILNSPRIPYWYLSVDYAKITIDGKPFWMPKTIKAEIRKGPNDPADRRFSAEYKNYRKFNVTSEIVY